MSKRTVSQTPTEEKPKAARTRPRYAEDRQDRLDEYMTAHDMVELLRTAILGLKHKAESNDLEPEDFLPVELWTSIIADDYEALYVRAYSPERTSEAPQPAQAA